MPDPNNFLKVIHPLFEIPPGFTLANTLQDGITDTIRTIAISSQTIATGSTDNTIRLWDPVSGQLKQTLQGHTGAVYSVAWSSDGRSLASGSSDNTIRIWDPVSGELKQKLQRHTSTVLSLSWSPNDRFLASSSNDKTIGLWDPVNGQLIGILQGHTGTIFRVAWSPDGRTLASSSFDSTIRLWDPVTSQLMQTFKGFGEAYSVVWSPDGHTLASGSDDYTIRLWDPLSGQTTNILEGHTATVDSLSFSADGKLLNSSSRKEEYLWDCKTWKLIAKLKYNKSTPGMNYSAFHPREPLLAVLNEYCTGFYLWKLDLNLLTSNKSLNQAIINTTTQNILNDELRVRKTKLDEQKNTNNYNQDIDTSIFQDKITSVNYDVFLCHNSQDKSLVKDIGMMLKENGITPWLDEWELRPGLPWQKVLEEQIEKINAAAVFIGKNGIGPWEDLELEAFLREFVKRKCPVIPVILSDCIETPRLPIFLGGMTWVDFRKKDPDPLTQLFWGITGKRNEVWKRIEREDYRVESDTLGSDEPLNADILEKILDNLWPPANKLKNEKYENLLYNLSKRGISTQKQLVGLINKHRDSVLQRAAREAEYIRNIAEFYGVINGQITINKPGKHSTHHVTPELMEKVKRGIFYGHVALTITAIQFEFEERKPDDPID